MVDREERVLITGARGMLGRAVAAAAPAPVPVCGVGREEVDLTSRDAVQRLFETRWSGVVHCAGYTDVDGAESHPGAARAGNVETTRLIAECAVRVDIPFLLVSTDYVFSGDASRPRRETDPTNPQGVYARSKREAEEVALAVHASGTRIVRTAWLYGAGGRNFPDTILQRAAAGLPLRVVDDQRGAPTWTEALAPALWFVLLHAPAGIYHATCEGSATWYEFARETLRIAGLDAPLEPCRTSEYPRAAPRPPFSVLDSGKLARLRAAPLPRWQDSLREYLRTIAIPGPRPDGTTP